MMVFTHMFVQKAKNNLITLKSFIHKLAHEKVRFKVHLFKDSSQGNTCVKIITSGPLVHVVLDDLCKTMDRK